MGERSASVHSDGSGSEVRIEDRWAAVRREESRHATPDEESRETRGARRAREDRWAPAEPAARDAVREEVWISPRDPVAPAALPAAPIEPAPTWTRGGRGEGPERLPDSIGRGTPAARGAGRSAEERDRGTERDRPSRDREVRVELPGRGGTDRERREPESRGSRWDTDGRGTSARDPEPYSREPWDTDGTGARRARAERPDTGRPDSGRLDSGRYDTDGRGGRGSERDDRGRAEGRGRGGDDDQWERPERSRTSIPRQRRVGIDSSDERWT